MQAVMDQKYEVTDKNGDIMVTLTANSQQLLSCTVSLTSPCVKDEPNNGKQTLSCIISNRLPTKKDAQHDVQAITVTVMAVVWISYIT